MDPRKFWTMCRLHDWFYYMSDDPGVWRDGQDSEDKLLSLAHDNPALTEIYNQWRDYHFSNGTKPAEPKLEDQ